MKLYKNLALASKERNAVRALKINIKGEDFPSELLEFAQLDELYLEGNCKNFPVTSPAWQNLKVLSIKWPQFTGDLLALFSLPVLENLKIIETPFKSFLLPLGQAAAPLKSLTVKDCGLKKLPEEISVLQNLTELNLSGNSLSDLPHAFKELASLRRLNLDQNKFTVFPAAIGEMPGLSHLSLDGNSFSDEEKARIQKLFHIWIN